ncbi:MAG: prepilin-type N-terminal cleavage/methylation domain-containing protein, partial [Planctomycetaceae bacterium]
MIQHVQTQPSKRSGFTLLEILIALGLMVLLIAAVSQSLTMYVNLSTLGREEAEQAQIGRAVVQQIARDIRSVTFNTVDQDDFLMDDSGGSEVGSEDEFGTDDGSDDFGTDTSMEADDTPPVETGILGSSEELILYVNRPERRVEYVAREDAVSPKDRVSDSLTVYYYLARPGGSGVPGEFAQTLTQGASSRDILGLARMEGDRQAINTAMAENDTNVQVEASSLLAEEIVAIQFRYFGGGEWVEEWDSVDSNSMPQAIEIIVSVQIPKDGESVVTPQSQFS